MIRPYRWIGAVFLLVLSWTMKGGSPLKIILEEALCDEAMALLDASGAAVAVDASLAEAAAADAVLLTGGARLPEAVYAPDARLRVLGLVSAPNENFELLRATRAGLVVLAPSVGEAASAADYAMHLMLEMARTPGDGPAFELREKTLGFVGFPPLAAEIAKRAAGFGMKLRCYDPDLNRGRAMLTHCEETPLVDLFVQSDFVMLLAPFAKWSQGLVGKDEIQLLHEGAGLIALTDARIFRWEELVRALDWGYLKHFAIDLPKEQAALAREVAPYCKVTVGEAANTREARIASQIELARDVTAALAGQQVETARNVPRVHAANLREGISWCELARLLGVFMGQRLAAIPARATVELTGPVPTAEHEPLEAALLAGLAEGLGAGKVNPVNSRFWAADHGLAVEVRQAPSASRSLLRLAVESDGSLMQVAGDRTGGAHNIIQVDDYHLAGHPHTHILLVPHINRPGVIGQVGTLLGEKDVNIAEMVLGYKHQDRSTALMWMQIESPVDRDIREESHKLASVLSMEYINLPIDE